MAWLFGFVKNCTFALGGMAEWSNAAVLKTVEQQCSGGSNPSSSAGMGQNTRGVFCPSFLLGGSGRIAVRCPVTVYDLMPSSSGGRDAVA